MVRKKAQFTPIAEVLCEATAERGIDREMKRYAIWQRWNNLVGTEVAAHARPARWQGTTLVIRAEHPAWIQELGFLKRRMLANIKEHMPTLTITDIRFEVGSLPKLDVEETETQEPSPPSRALSGDEESLVKEASSSIADPEIRDAAERAMAKYLARKE